MKTGQALLWLEDKGILRLNNAKLKSNNFWTISRAEVVNQTSYFWIKPAKNTRKTLTGSSLSSKIKVSAIDQTLDICLWEFVEYNLRGDDFKGLAVIQSLESKLALEVPECSLK
jgi:hypothetical protein